MKDPAFLFYPADYVTGTMGMTFEQKGAYVDLLMMQFARGHMTSHMIGQVLGHNGGQIWDAIKSKFEIDENGLYYNVRLEQEQNKRKAFTDSRKNNIKGKNQHEGKIGHMGGQMTTHMVNININGDKDLKEGGVGETIDYEQLINYWNEHSGLTQIIGLTQERKDQINFIIKENGKANLKEAIDLCGKSKYLHGENKDKFVAHFDWFIIHKNFIKVLEGNYNNRKVQKEVIYNL